MGYVSILADPEFRSAMINFAEVYVDTATKLLEKEARQCILAFYTDYPNPIRYVRTDNFKNSVQVSYKNHGNGKAYGYVDITTEKMDEYKIGSPNRTGISTFSITSDAWIWGVHGNMAVKQMSPTPYAILENYYYDRGYNNEALKAAMDNTKYLVRRVLD